ncbi:unnamed protein product [Urochloa humidicola]
MASPNNGAVLRLAVPVAACIALVLLPMGPPVMADVQDVCRSDCLIECTDLVSTACEKVIGIAPVLKSLPSFLEECKAQVTPTCSTITCNNICIGLKPCTPAPPPASPAPPCTPAPAPAPAPASPGPCADC